MASTWSSGLTFQTPGNAGSVSEPEKGIYERDNFTFKDFLPECRERGGFFSKPVFDTFRSVVDRANQWLRSNPEWKIKTCESVEFKIKGENPNYEKMTYVERGEYSTTYIRGLRLWIVKRRNIEERNQEIGFFNLIPQETPDSGIFSSSYEKLQDVLNGFNSHLTQNGISGRIITVESQEMKLSTIKELNPDKSSWEERGDRYKRFLFIIRVFFEVMNGVPEEIGVIDFLPSIVKKSGIFSLPQYEPFSNVIKKASDWCVQQHGIRFVNAQSLEIKIPSGLSYEDIDPQKMHYTEHGSRSTFYLRILRVAYTKSVTDAKVDRQQPLSLRQLTCKTFYPVQLTNSLFVPEFETLSVTKNRISAWVKATGAEVLSAETAALRIFTGGEARYGSETTFTYNRAERNEYWIFVIRLYMNGNYTDPPEEMLPPVPEIEQSCCVLC